MSFRFPTVPMPIPFERKAADWLVGSLGFSVAFVSASFAAYMVVFGPAQLVGAIAPMADATPRDLTAKRQPGVPPADLAVAASAQGSVAMSDIDFTPTGSIAASSGTRTSLRSGVARPSAAAIGQHLLASRVSSVVLRDVFDGKALVEERNKLRLIEPGSVLDDAGEVLAIRRRGTGWVVETDRGVIE